MCVNISRVCVEPAAAAHGDPATRLALLFYLSNLSGRARSPLSQGSATYLAVRGDTRDPEETEDTREERNRRRKKEGNPGGTQRKKNGRRIGDKRRRGNKKEQHERDQGITSNVRPRTERFS